jgi:hypothetical protein
VIGGGEGGAALADVAAGFGVADGGGAGAGTLLAEDEPFEAAGISSLVKYRKPPTPMAARHTTATTKGPHPGRRGVRWRRYLLLYLRRRVSFICGGA